MATNDIILHQKNSNDSFVERVITPTPNSALIFDANGLPTAGSVSSNLGGDATGPISDVKVLKVTPNANALAGCEVSDLTADTILTANSKRHQLLSPVGEDRTVVLPTISSNPEGDEVAVGWSIKLENTGVDGYVLFVKNSVGVMQAQVESGDVIVFSAVATGNVWRANLDPANQPFVTVANGIDVSQPAGTRYTVYTVPSDLSFVIQHAYFLTTHSGGLFSTGYDIELCDSRTEATLMQGSLGESPGFYASFSPVNLRVIKGGDSIVLKINVPVSEAVQVGKLMLVGFLIVQ